MARLAGLQGIGQEPGTQETDQGVLEAHGGPVDASHSHYGDMYGDSWPSAFGTGYHGTSNPMDVDQGEYPEFNQPGRLQDKTPTTHVAPYPRGIIQPNLEDTNSFATVAYQVQVQRAEVHGGGLGAPAFFNQNAQGGREYPHYTSYDRYQSPSVNNLAMVPGQIRYGNNGIGRDTSQGYGQLNSTEEFANGHSMRIVAHDGLAWDRSLEYAPPQIFRGKFPVQQVGFDVDSPYGSVLGDTSTGQQVVWEGRIGDPTAYVGPPEPRISQVAQEQDAWAYYG